MSSSNSNEVLISTANDIYVFSSFQVSVADGSITMYPNLPHQRKDSSASFRQTSRSSIQNQDNRSHQRTDSRESIASTQQKIKRKETTGLSSTKLNDLSPFVFLFSHSKPYTGGTCPIKIIVNVKSLSFEEKLMNQSENKFTSLQITSPTTLLLTSPNDDLKTKKIVSKEKIYQFEYVQDEQADNSLLYQRSISTSVQRFVSGVNQSILVIGGDGSGKQQTMVGTMRDPGLFILALKEIFDILYESPYREQTTLKCSMYYNKGPHFYDLLVSHQYPLKLAERDNAEPYPRGVSEVILTNMLTSLKILKIGLDKLDNDQTIRKEGNIILNFRCERSNSNPFISQDTYVSFLRIIKFSDAPFSEVAGQNIAENNILTNIENIARQLSQASKKKTWCQVSFRGSIFTEYLRESLIGNSETSIVFCVSTSIQKVSETSQILRLAAMIGRISTNPASSNVINATRIQRQYSDCIDKITNAVSGWVKEMWGELETDKIKRLNKVLSIFVALENALNNLAHMNEQWLQMELLRNGMLGRALDLHCGLYSRSITSEEIKEFYIASLNRHASKQLQPKLAQLYNPLAFTLHQQLINKVNLISANNAFANSFVSSSSINSGNIATGLPSNQSGSNSVVTGSLTENKLLSQQPTQRYQLKSTPNSPALNSISSSNPRSSQIGKSYNYPQAQSKIYQQLLQPALQSHSQHRNNNNNINIHSNPKINSSFTNLPPSMHNIDRSNSYHSAINTQNSLHNGGGGAANTAITPSILAGQDFEKATGILKMLEKLQKSYENLLEHNIYIPQDIRKDIATALKEYKFLQKTLLEESANASEEIPQHHRNQRFSSRYFIAASKQASVRNSVFKIIHDGQQSEGGIDDMKPLRSITTEEDIPDAYEDEDSDSNDDDEDEYDEDDDQQSNEEDTDRYFQSSDQQRQGRHYKSIDSNYIKALQIKLGLGDKNKNKIFVNHTKLSIPIQSKQYNSNKLDSSIKDMYINPSSQSQVQQPQYSSSDKRSISSTQLNLTGYQFRQEQVPEIPQESLGDHAKYKLKTMLQGQQQNQKQIQKQQQDQSKTLLRFSSNQSLSQFMQNEENDLIEKIFTSNTRYNSTFRNTKQKNFFNLNSPCYASNNLSQNINSSINNKTQDYTETSKNNNSQKQQRNFFLLTQKPTATSTTNQHKNTFDISNSSRKLLSMTNLNFFKPTNIPQHNRKFPKIINTLFSSNLQQYSAQSTLEKSNIS